MKVLVSFVIVSFISLVFISLFHKNPVPTENLPETKKTVQLHKFQPEPQLPLDSTINSKQGKNYFEDLPPLSHVQRKYGNFEDNELRSKLKAISGEIASSRLIERANDGTLSDSERKSFAKLMNEESAIKLTLLERQLERAEDEI